MLYARITSKENHASAPTFTGKFEKENNRTLLLGTYRLNKKIRVLSSFLYLLSSVLFLSLIFNNNTEVIAMLLIMLSIAYFTPKMLIPYYNSVIKDINKIIVEILEVTEVLEIKEESIINKIHKYLKK